MSTHTQARIDALTAKVDRELSRYMPRASEALDALSELAETALEHADGTADEARMVELINKAEWAVDFFLDAGGQQRQGNALGALYALSEAAKGEE